MPAHATRSGSTPAGSAARITPASPCSMSGNGRAGRSLKWWIMLTRTQ
ncbi:hypothetical protein [Fimbriiglobus ruber]